MQRNKSRSFVTIQGEDFFGKKRNFEIALLEARQGLELFQRCTGGIIQFVETCERFFDGDPDMGMIAMAAQMSFTPEDFRYLSGEVLFGLKIDGKKIDDIDPLLSYAAIYHALQRNLGATLDPILMPSRAERKAKADQDDSNTIPKETTPSQETSQ